MKIKEGKYIGNYVTDIKGNIIFKGTKEEFEEYFGSGMQHKEGIKHDTEKPMMSLLPFDALDEVAKVLTYGAKKYSPDGWRKVEIDRYKSALIRHLSAYLQGEELDPESNLSHVAHMACNALFLVALEKNK